MASATKAKAELTQLESLHTALAKILQNQLRARAAASGLPRLTTQTEAGKLAGDVRGQQVAIQKATTEVVTSIESTDEPDRLTIKRVVNKLAVGEMVQAVRQAEALEQVRAVSELATRPAGGAPAGVAPPRSSWQRRTRSSTSSGGCWARSARKPPNCSPR